MPTFRFLFIFIILFSLKCSPPFKQGEEAYKEHCSGCHGINGEGLKSMFPPIKNSSFLINNLTQIPCIIKNGISDTLLINNRTFTTPMEGFNKMSDIEITNITNFIVTRWYNKANFIRLTDVKEQLQSCKN